MRSARTLQSIAFATDRHLLVVPTLRNSLLPPLAGINAAPGSSRQIHASTSLLAKKGKGGKGKAAESESSADQDDSKVQEVTEKTRGKMSKAVDWAKGQVYDGVERARGRVSPSILDNVKVSLPDDPALIPLLQVASVTVKQNTLLVEVWDSTASKHVESAIHKANLPGISPQRTGDNTFKIPMSRPTVEQRSLILKSLNESIESAKQQVRMARNDGMKSLGGRGKGDTEEIQKLADKFGGELDEVLSKAKKEMDK